MNKLVSVIIPTYGGAEYLKRCVDSVLAQTYQNIEVIVVDDNGMGTPNQLLTQKVMEGYKDEPHVKYICHEVNINGSAARNTGFRNSNGEYICLLDDDDEYYPEKVERQVNNLDANPNCGLTYCQREMYVNGKLTSVKHAMKSDNYLFDLLIHKVGISSGTLMVRRNIWEQIGGFDESLRRHQDYEFTARVASVCDIYPDDFLGLKKNMIGRNNAKDYKQAFEFRKKYIERVQPLFYKLDDNQKRIVIETNYLGIACQALSCGDLKTFFKICNYTHLKMSGLKFLVSYYAKSLKTKFRKFGLKIIHLYSFYLR